MNEVDERVKRALEVYAAHRWNATTRLCACGETFPATLMGHAAHKAHRMEAVLTAAAEVVLAAPEDITITLPSPQVGSVVCEPKPLPMCSNCGAQVTINTIKMHELQVFCPNGECSVFMNLFWIER